jgi:hypothetical protein
MVIFIRSGPGPVLQSNDYPGKNTGRVSRLYFLSGIPGPFDLRTATRAYYNPICHENRGIGQFLFGAVDRIFPHLPARSR